ALTHYLRFPLSINFLCTHPPPTHTYTLSLHDALPIYFPSSLQLPPPAIPQRVAGALQNLPIAGSLLNFIFKLFVDTGPPQLGCRSEEHTSELQSRGHLVCRLLLEKKKRIAREFRSRYN